MDVYGLGAAQVRFAWGLDWFAPTTPALNFDGQLNISFHFQTQLRLLEIRCPLLRTVYGKNGKVHRVPMRMSPKLLATLTQTLTWKFSSQVAARTQAAADGTLKQQLSIMSYHDTTIQVGVSPILESENMKAFHHAPWLFSVSGDIQRTEVRLRETVPFLLGSSSFSTLQEGVRW